MRHVAFCLGLCLFTGSTLAVIAQDARSSNRFPPIDPYPDLISKVNLGMLVLSQPAVQEELWLTAEEFTNIRNRFEEAQKRKHRSRQYL